MYKFTKQHKDFAIGDVCTYTGDYLQALIDMGAVEEVKNGLKGMPSMKETSPRYVSLNTIGGMTFNHTNESLNKFSFERGNDFPGQEEALEHNNWLIARTELIRACYEISGGENGWIEGEDNWNVIYDHCDNELSLTASEYQQSNESFLHLRTADQAQRLIDEHSDALKVYLGVE